MISRWNIMLLFKTLIFHWLLVLLWFAFTLYWFCAYLWTAPYTFYILSSRHCCEKKPFLSFLPISVSTRKCRTTPPNICYHHTCITEGWYATIEWQILVSIATYVPGYCIALLLVVGGACSMCKSTTQTMEYYLVMSCCELTPYRSDTMVLGYVPRIQLYIVFSRNSCDILFILTVFIC